MLVFTLTPALRPDASVAAVRAGDVAAVVLRMPEGAPDIAHLRAGAEAIQTHHAGVLVGGPATLAAAAGLDGVHVSDLRGLDAALRALKPQAIVGAGGITTRHDAMEAGEGGADYVFFGALEPPAAASAETLDLVNWWAEGFEVPCVGLAATLDEAEALAGAGADFVALAEVLVAEGGPATVTAAMDRLTSMDAQP